MTIKELKELITNLPDEMEVITINGVGRGNPKDTDVCVMTFTNTGSNFVIDSKGDTKMLLVVSW